MKTIDERILAAESELVELKFFLSPTNVNRNIAEIHSSIISRAERRLADLEAVRDGRACEVYATVSVEPDTLWIAYGQSGESGPMGEMTLCELSRSGDDRLTILRGIARLPEVSTDECEAESEGL